MSGAHTVALDLSQTDAIDAVTAALSAQGFGVLTTIDVRATLKAKLGEDVEDYTILGACNPALAHQALSAEPEIGLLLPCNVTVRRAGGRTLVQAVDPAIEIQIAEERVFHEHRVGLHDGNVVEVLAHGRTRRAVA